MKQLYIIIIVGFFAFTSSFAQVMEKDLRMSEGIQNALVVELKGADAKKAEKIWKDFAKEFGKVEKDRKMKEFFIEQTIIPSIDQEYAVDIFTKFDQYESNTRAYFWFKMDDRYLNSIDDEDEINGADVFLTDYSIEVEKEVVKDELKDEENGLKNLQKGLSKLEKEESNLHKDIQKAKDAIRKAEEKLVDNAKEQKEKMAEIGNQEEVVKMVAEKLNNVGKN